jgi:hypothetical protein
VRPDVAFACVAVLAMPALARADGGADSFQRGKDLLGRGLVTEACETLTRAEAEAPSVGTIGLLAACHEKQGRVASALREYQEAARRAAAAHDPRERFARDRADKLEPSVPRLVVRLPLGEAIRVTIGGSEIDAASLSTTTRVDPGAVEIVARSDAGKTWSTRLVLERGEERVVAVPSLAPAVVAAPPSPKRSAPSAALVAGGVGVVGLGIMGGFGASAAAQNADSKSIESRCQAGAATPAACAAGQSERDRARAFGNVATAGFVVGVAGLGAGALLWALDGGSSERRQALILGPAFSGVRGTF